MLLSNAQSITQELKEYEEKDLGAEDRYWYWRPACIQGIGASAEWRLFLPFRSMLTKQHVTVCCVANVAKENNYIRPLVRTSDVLDIRQGRHPVIEKAIADWKNTQLMM